MKINKLNLLGICCALMLIGSSCTHKRDFGPCNVPMVATGDSIPCDPNVVYFERDVLPILISNCAMAGCHDAITAEEDVILDSYANTMATGGVSPCDPWGSGLYTVLFEKGDKMMPPQGYTQLSLAQSDMIANWINQGAENFTCLDQCDTTNVTFSTNIWPVMENYCLGCHSGNSPGGGVALTNYQEIKASAENGSLYGTLIPVAPYSLMPPGNPLSTCQINSIRIWIDAGMPNN